ncbi:hypothetical protein EDD16DRAFT_1610712 [Pisolithus croceorrhizus]|nr:hypothetical protein EDD16DRAFT_1610712 [Pisolithus croceorrhizus]
MEVFDAFIVLLPSSLSWTVLSLMKSYFNNQRTDVKSEFMNQSHDRNQGRCRSRLPNGGYDHAKRRSRGKRE